MTRREEIQLLLQDLCARLPYGVEVVYLATTYTIQYIDIKFGEVKLNGLNRTLDIGHIKPYLRPMSSMTEEEKKEYYGCVLDKNIESLNRNFRCDIIPPTMIKIDWLNAHHFDYRGLIEKGLALEAPEGMYKIE